MVMCLLQCVCVCVRVRVFLFVLLSPPLLNILFLWASAPLCQHDLLVLFHVARPPLHSKSDSRAYCGRRAASADVEVEATRDRTRPVKAKRVLGWGAVTGVIFDTAVNSRQKWVLA